MDAFDRALRELHQVPLAEFVAVRARLAAALRAAGDAAGAAALAKRRRPTASAWAVNRLYARARDRFDDVMAAAARMRRGDLGAAGAYREALAALRRRAAEELEQGGHRATDATLRRVSATLAAIAAAGGFDPDPPGALVADRDPPGFDAAGVPAKTRPGGPPPHAATRGPARDATADRARAAREARQAAEAEKKRRADERVRRDERRRLATALRVAKATLTTRERALRSLETRYRAAERAAADARATVERAERALRELDARG